jgi:hypothetical protein
MFEPGALLDTIYFPQTGLVSLLLTAAGDTLETTMVGREGAVGLQGRFGTRFSRAVVQIGGRFSSIRAARFAELVDGNAASAICSRATARCGGSANRSLQRRT